MPLRSRETIIYRIFCATSGKSYVGMTACSLKKRWQGHLADAKAHRFNSLLHRAIRAHGPGAFTCEIIGTAPDRHTAGEIEKQKIVECGSMAPKGYNSAPGGSGGPTRIGRKHSAETRKKMSKSAKGKRKSPTHREALSASHKGIKPSRANLSKRAASMRRTLRAKRSDHNQMSLNI